MPLFRNYGQVWYTLENGDRVLINDITKFVTIPDRIKNNDGIFITHYIRDGDTPGKLSNRLYGTPDYFWTIYVINDMYNFNDRWPLNDEMFEIYLSKKYPNINTYQTVKHYINLDGLVTDLDSYRFKENNSNITDDYIISKYNLTPVTIREFEEQVNEEKRSIKVIREEYIREVDGQLRELFNGK